MGLFDFHHPWVFAFGVIGNIVSLCVYLAPLPTFVRIYKGKSTLGYQSLPYVVALFSAMLWMYYAFLKKNAILLVSINAVGTFIEAIYVFIYLVYASKTARNHTLKLLSSLIGGLLSVVFVLSLVPLETHLRVHIVGWICVAVSVSVFAAPLSIVFQVVRTRSVEFMPLNLSIFLTITAVSWFTYGMLLHDLCVALPNVAGFFLGMLQMLLYAIYRNAKTPEVLEMADKKLPEHIINIVGMGAAEVHPVDSQSSGSDTEACAAEEIVKKQLPRDDEGEEEEAKIDAERKRESDEESGREHEESVADDDREREASPVKVQLDDLPVLVVCAAA